MGTRATIIIEENQNQVFLYRPQDGYPGAVLPDLESLNNKIGTSVFWNNARLAQYLIQSHDCYLPGRGISNDVEFVYIVNMDRARGITRIIVKEYKILDTRILTRATIIRDPEDARKEVCTWCRGVNSVTLCLPSCTETGDYRHCEECCYLLKEKLS